MTAAEQLETKRAALKTALRNRAEVLAALRKMDAEARTAATEDEAEQRSATVALADAVLQEKPTNSIIDRLFGHRDRMHVISLTRAGLRAKLDAIEVEIHTVRIPEFTEAHQARAAQVIEAFAVEYRKAAGPFLATLRRGAALGMALGNSALEQACAMSGAFDPFTLDKMDAADGWESDSKARAVFDANRAPAELLQIIESMGMPETPARIEWWNRMEAALA